jgi:hypothetical protein
VAASTNAGPERSKGATRARAPRPVEASTAKAAAEPAGPIGLVGRIGPFEVDWPRSLGFFGGVGVAVGIGLIDPPLGLFIAAVPFLKMLDLPGLPTRTRFMGQVFEGVAKPVGGDSDGTVRLVTARGSNTAPVAGEG